MNLREFHKKLSTVITENGYSPSIRSFNRIRIEKEGRTYCPATLVYEKEFGHFIGMYEVMKCLELSLSKRLLSLIVRASDARGRAKATEVERKKLEKILKLI